MLKATKCPKCAHTRARLAGDRAVLNTCFGTFPGAASVPCGQAHAAGVHVTWV